MKRGKTFRIERKGLRSAPPALLYLSGTWALSGLIICATSVVAQCTGLPRGSFLVALVFLLCGWFWINHAKARIESIHKTELDTIRAFANDTGHEVATIAAVLRSKLQVMEADYSRETRVLSDLQLLSQPVLRLSNLIDASRAIANAERQGHSVDLSITKLDDVVHAAIKQLKGSFDSRSMRVLDSGVSPCVLACDAEGLARLVSNLLSNAARYGRAGGQVEVKLSQTRTHVNFEVTDDGAGIAPEFLPLIFERFYRVASDAQQVDGLGLGLAIVKAVVDSQGGSLTVSSEVGSGSSFVVSLPKFPPRHPLFR